MDSQDGEERRVYESPLRKAQAAQTRELIGKALVEQLNDESFDDFSVPKVAKRAGVSVRTVYRHYPTRDALLGAIDSYFSRDAPRREWTIDTLPAFIADLFKYFERNEDVIEAAFRTNLGREYSSRGHKRRTERFTEEIAKGLGDLPDDERMRITAILRLVHGVGAYRTMRDDYGLSGDESGKAAEWALKTLIADAKRRNKKAAKARDE